MGVNLGLVGDAAGRKPEAVNGPIENLISVLIVQALKDLGRTDLIVDSCNVDLSRRIKNLDSSFWRARISTNSER